MNSIALVVVSEYSLNQSFVWYFGSSGLVAMRWAVLFGYNYSIVENDSLDNV